MTRDSSKTPCVDLIDDENDALSLLKKTLEEKTEADQKLTQPARDINVEAGEFEELGEESLRSTKSAKSNRAS